MERTVQLHAGHCKHIKLDPFASFSLSILCRCAQENNIFWRCAPNTTEIYFLRLQSSDRIWTTKKEVNTTNTTNNTNRNVVQFGERKKYSKLHWTVVKIRLHRKRARPGCVCMQCYACVQFIRMYLACKFNH